MTGRGVLLLVLLLLAPAIVLRPPTRQQELRVLITARNMVESGDWLHPQFQNQPRFRKPPLAYWTTAAAMALTGVHDEAWAARLPALAIALGCVALLLRLGGPLGIPAALLFAFSFGFWRFAPLAETDFLLLFGILLAFEARRMHNGILCGLGLAIGMLAKGPAGLVLPLATWVTEALLPPPSPDPSPVRRLCFYLPALAIPLMAGGAWLLFLQSDPTARQALARELRDTFLESPHAGPWYYYLYTLPLLLLPSVFLVLPAFRRLPLPPPGVLPWLLSTLALLSLVDSKQRHYALLALPPACLLLAPYIPARFLKPAPWIAAALLIALAEVPRAALDPDNAHLAFLRSIRPLVRNADTLHVVGINSAVFDFALGRHVENIDSARAALRRARPGDAVVILQPRSRYDAVSLPQAPARDASSPDWIRTLHLP